MEVEVEVVAGCRLEVVAGCRLERAVEVVEVDSPTQRPPVTSNDLQSVSW